jgi:hypothetical protein
MVFVGVMLLMIVVVIVMLMTQGVSHPGDYLGGACTGRRRARTGFVNSGGRRHHDGAKPRNAGKQWRLLRTRQREHRIYKGVRRSSLEVVE